jgi:DNA ligase-1
MPKDVALDGELFTSRGKFQNTVSVVKKISPVNSEWKRIVFKVFDSPTLEGTYDERYKQLQKIVSNLKYANLVSQIPVTSKNQMIQLYRKVLENKGEGLMLRNPKMKYVRKRTKDLLKVKPIDDSEGIIVSMMEGKGKDSGRMGALVVTLKNNSTKKFKIGTGFTDAMRQNFWNKRLNYKNKVVTFSYKGLTNAGKPRHPVFMRMRDIA